MMKEKGSTQIIPEERALKHPELWKIGTHSVQHTQRPAR